MSPPGRPKSEYRSAQREGLQVSTPGCPEGEYRSAQRERTPVAFAPVMAVAVAHGLASSHQAKVSIDHRRRP